MRDDTTSTPRRRAGRLLAAALGAATLAGGADAARAATFQVVYTFSANASDGVHPVTPKLAVDPFGAVYGTTSLAGPMGSGMVWKLQTPAAGSSTGQLSVVHALDF